MTTLNGRDILEVVKKFTYNKGGYMSKTIKVSDKIGESLELLADSEGNTMAAEISILIAEHNMAKQICERLSGVERALKEMQVYKPEPVVVPTLIPSVSPAASPAAVTYETYEKSDKTYDELMNELSDLQKKYNELDDKDSERGRELANKMRAISVDLSLVDED